MGWASFDPRSVFPGSRHFVPSWSDTDARLTVAGGIREPRHRARDASLGWLARRAVRCGSRSAAERSITWCRMPAAYIASTEEQARETRDARAIRAEAGRRGSARARGEIGTPRYRAGHRRRTIPAPSAHFSGPLPERVLVYVGAPGTTSRWTSRARARAGARVPRAFRSLHGNGDKHSGNSEHGKRKVTICASIPDLADILSALRVKPQGKVSAEWKARVDCACAYAWCALRQDDMIYNPSRRASRAPRRSAEPDGETTRRSAPRRSSSRNKGQGAWSRSSRKDLGYRSHSGYVIHGAITRRSPKSLRDHTHSLAGRRSQPEARPADDDAAAMRFAKVADHDYEGVVLERTSASDS